MIIEWYKCKGGIWCELNKIDLSHDSFDKLSGVYVIWHSTNKPVVVKVGSGIIRDELRKNKDDIAIQAFTKYGLFVSWAETPLLKRKPIETFLALELAPTIFPELSKTKPIQVNFPWDEIDDE